MASVLFFINRDANPWLLGGRPPRAGVNRRRCRFVFNLINGDFKSYTARKVIDYLSARHVRTLLDGLEYHKARHKSDRQFQLWQEESHPKIIEIEAMMSQKLKYIHDNPVRQGYVSDPTHWRYSSARNYAKMESLVSVATEW